GGGQAEGADGHAACGVLDFRVAAEVADQDDLVDAACHVRGVLCAPAMARIVASRRVLPRRPGAGSRARLRRGGASVISHATAAGPPTRRAPGGSRRRRIVILAPFAP